MRNGMRAPAFLVTLAVLAAGMLVLLSISDSLLGALFFLPFSLGPLFVSLILAAKSPGRLSQRLLLASSILYAVWFGYIYLEAFHWHVDPQSAVAMVFIGLLSLPVMIPVWIVSLLQIGRSTAPGAPIGTDRPSA
ncbi:hypothetical protein DES53_102934 [Roseimicrobium gellanilyticum]|uniref:Uncharacterized protein n=1 Tax=Roseimicrobium gellanilyticum TaxID=748857 RepID=A0A366HUD3_9BACT|nr:hypothetical protein [Roseimicrobium gellanilyticum]RBP46543.1 hypothetical protein DES53_102934 [Roseimicrobium gellanilyticum]